MPIDALRDEIAQANAHAMLDEARQRLARRWPFASAQLDLPLSTRIAFVLGVVACPGGGACAIWSKPLFMPLVGLLLAVPASSG